MVQINRAESEHKQTS